MKQTISRAALYCLIFTALWLVFMIAAMAVNGPVDSYEKAIASVTNIDSLFILTYINAILVTVTVTVLFIRFFSRYKPSKPKLSLTGFVFIPVYAILNLVVYATQITVVPYLNAQTKNAINPDLHQRFMALWVQAWSGSTMAMLNQLAYAVLAIPSIIFGCLLIKERAKFSGGLLILNGIACIIGLVGTVGKSDILAIGSVAGGALFLAALIALISEAGLHEREDIDDPA